MQELPRQPLYRVTFHQGDVWEGYTGQPQDTVDVEVYQAWLEPATPAQLQQQQEGNHHLHPHTHEHGHHGHGKQHGDPQVIGHGDHTHESRNIVEQNAIDLEGEDDVERSRLSEALVKVMSNPLYFVFTLIAQDIGDMKPPQVEFQALVACNILNS